jgi:cation diffusion facilitator family transporter
VQQGSRRAVLAAALANAGIALAKFVAFLVTGAASMLAEAVHSVADTGNQVLLLRGGAAARREPTPEHPFGYGRERYFWAFVVALVLFALGGLFAVNEGLDKLRHPHDLEKLEWAVGVLLLGIGLEANSLRIAVWESRPHKGEASWWSFVRRTKNPELPVVLLEDLGALCGLILALIGIALAAATGDPRFDALGSIGVGVLLVAISALLALEMKSLLIGESAEPGDLELIRSSILEDERIRRVIHMRTQHSGPDQLLVGAKLEFDPDLGSRDVAAAIDRAEDRIRARLPIARFIYLEPDLLDEEI